jgi:hypothetical protein
MTGVRVAVFCLALPLSAQWLHYPTAGVPRLPDGSPNLNAPAPRSADGTPDLSGIWFDENNRPCPPNNCDDMLTSQEFWDMGWSLKGGLPYQPWAAALIKQRQAAFGQGDPTSHCLPGGVLKMHGDPLMRKIVQVPGMVIILNERNASYRQIFTDGRPLPQDPQPAWNGYSTGTWQGTTLTEAGTITERFHRVSYGKLEIEITVDDPRAYNAPWTIKLNQLLKVDTELLDYICLENEKDTPHLVGK